jgi:regulator of protease activity HflC (stomatin/prohibitin superfamily)
MDRDFPRVSIPVPGASRVGLVIVAIVAVILFLAAGPIRTVPAGNVGVKDFFGSVSASTLSPGINLVMPLTSVVRMSVQTQEIKEIAEVPSQEGLILSLETSLLFQLDPAKAVDIYRTVGSDYVGTIVEPQFRSSIREITASYEAKALYSAEREKIAGEIFTLFRRRQRDSGKAAARAGSRADEVRAAERAAGSRAQTNRSAGRRRLPAHRRAGHQSAALGVERHRGDREAGHERQLEGRGHRQFQERASADSGRREVGASRTGGSCASTLPRRLS